MKSQIQKRAKNSPKILDTIKKKNRQEVMIFKGEQGVALQYNVCLACSRHWAQPTPKQENPDTAQNIRQFQN